MSNVMGDALAYAARGWHVFPIWPRSKAPVTLRGFYDATLDVDTIRRWFRRPMNVGISAGPSGLCVVDIDPRSGGDVAFEAWCERFGPCPETPCVMTGGGGMHYYFKAPRLPDGAKVGPAWRHEETRLEFKAVGGYVLAPPSIHPSGKPYEWEASSRFDEVELAEMPARWVHALPLVGQSGQFGPPVGAVTESPIWRICAEMGLGPKALPDGVRAAITCPWAHEHTHDLERSQGQLDTSAAIFAPTNRLGVGGFKCQHAHCAHRRAKDLIALASAEIVRRHSPKPRW